MNNLFSEVNIRSIEERLSYRFKDKMLIQKALTHTSYANESGMPFSMSNERLEFLGDAVLDLITSMLLMDRFPDFDEGGLSKLRSRVVSEDSLNSIGEELELGKLICLGKGEENSGGRGKSSIVSSTFEAVVAAVFIDAGFEKTFDIIGGLLKDSIEDIWLKGSYLDYKTLLQELSQKLYKKAPQYRVVNEKGPEHFKVFEVDVFINDKLFGTGAGRSKRDAEKDAAKKAYKRLRGLKDS